MTKAYIVRDKGGELVLHINKPFKSTLYWISDNWHCMDLPKELLPSGENPKWDDETPIEVNVTITKTSDDVVTIPKDRYEQLLQYEKEYAQRQSLVNSLFIQNKNKW